MHDCSYNRGQARGMQVAMGLACNLCNTRLRGETAAQLPCKINNYYMALSANVLPVLLSEKELVGQGRPSFPAKARLEDKG
jgi:hypothetical protein